MSPEAFNALCKLLRSPPGPAQDAARQVLVDGQRPADVARTLDVSPAVVSNAVTRMRAGLELARIAAAG